MQARRCLYDIADFTRLESKRSFLKLFLHIAFAKEATVDRVR